MRTIRIFGRSAAGSASRHRAVTFLVAAASCVVVPVANASTLLPFASTAPYTKCGRAAEQAGPASQSRCELVADASPATGAVQASSTMVSPLGGFAPWTATAASEGNVLAAYDLASPVQQLNFTVYYRVNHGTIELSNLPGTLDSWLDFGNYGSAEDWLSNWESLLVVARAWSPACGINCATGGNQAVLTRSGETGKAAISNQEYVLQFSMRNAGGGDIPAGPVYVTAGVAASIVQDASPGNDSARINGFVKGIYLD